MFYHEWIRLFMERRKTLTKWERRKMKLYHRIACHVKSFERLFRGE